MKQHHYYSINPTGLHKLAYTEWGSPNSRATICIHGLNRNSRDFDPLAKALSEQGHWVICLDLPGRGLSDWLTHSDHYSFAQYLQDIATLIARLNVEQVDWIGTSLGGLLGIIFASLLNNPIKRLIINDIGPDIPQKGVLRLEQNRSDRPAHFPSIEAAERYFRKIYAPFGELSDADWRAMTKHGIRPNRQGGYCFHSDPNIAVAAIDQKMQENLWQCWQKSTCPALILQGEESDFLLLETLTRMKKTRRHVDAITFPLVGHAPPLRHIDQIQAVCDWLKTH